MRQTPAVSAPARRRAPTVVAAALFASVALAAGASAAQSARARAITARLAAMNLGPNAAAIRSVLTEFDAVRAASIEVLPTGAADVAIVDWDHAWARRPNPWDLRYVRAFAPEGNVDLTEYFQYLGRDPDSDGAIPNRVEGSISVSGDPRRGVALVSAGDRVRALVAVRGGQLAHAGAECDGPGGRVVRTVCGLGFVCSEGARLLDANTLAERTDACSRGMGEVLRAASAVDAAMVAADRALETVAPTRRGASPGAPLAGPAVTCARPTADPAAVLRLVAAMRTPRGARRPVAGALRVDPSDFGCVNPRTGAYLVRVRNGQGDAVIDALVSVSGERARLAAGWTGDETSIETWFEVDLDGDGAAESVIDQRHGNMMTRDLRVYRSDGTRVSVARELVENSSSARPGFDPAGHALMVDHRLYRVRGNALVPATAAQLPALAAALEARMRTLFAAPERASALRASVYADVPGGTDAPLPRAHPSRVAWESAMVAALEARGVQTAQARALVAFDPRGTEAAPAR